MNRLAFGLVAGAYAVAVGLGFLLPLVLRPVEAVEAAFLLGCLATLVGALLVSSLER